MSPVPVNGDKRSRDSRTRIRPDAYAELVRLDTIGLETCDGTCARRWSLGRCEHHELERHVGYEIDPTRPSDYLIGLALRLIADQCDYEGADQEAAIIEACNDGRISPERRNMLLEHARETREREVEAAAFELLTMQHVRSSLRSTPERRWRTDLDIDERREQHRLQELRFNGGWSPDDRAAYLELTEPQPPARVDWDKLPSGFRAEAERIVDKRRRRVRGELPRSVRVSATDRRRRPTFEVPSFRKQIGAVGTATTPAEIERAVRDFRRAAKRLGLLPPEHDRRTG